MTSADDYNVSRDRKGFRHKRVDSESYGRKNYKRYYDATRSSTNETARRTGMKTTREKNRQRFPSVFAYIYV